MPDTIIQPHPARDQADDLPQWTVIGLLDMDGNLTVAGVAAGEIAMHDSDWGEDNAQRWAQSFAAPTPDDAEALAVAYCADQDDDETFHPGDRVQHIVNAAHEQPITGTVLFVRDDEEGTPVRVAWPTGHAEHSPGELLHVV
ncbi:hypothetical protein ABZ569_33330 [Streptomyces albus]|uniref:hypothetical protein n=1 Tax=Streptomyces albus TaxID=1888 RepID=UPI0033FE5E89